MGAFTAMVVSFLVLASLLLWVVIDVRGRWWLKGGLIVGVAVFAILAGAARGSFSGWATSESPPTRALFMSGVAREPDKRTGTDGAIYLWLIPPRSSSRNVFAYDASEPAPRAYKLPYSREAHEQLEKAKQLAKGGVPVEIRREKGRKGGSARPGQKTPKLMFRAYRLPPARLPRKRSS
jgi:hypothetical protein